MATCSADSNLSVALLYNLKQLGSLNISLKRSFCPLKLYNSRKDIFMWSSTGFGKTLHFQVLSFLMDHKLGLVFTEKSCSMLLVSPLVVVMMDQPLLCEAQL